MVIHDVLIPPAHPRSRETPARQWPALPGGLEPQSLGPQAPHSQHMKTESLKQDPYHLIKTPPRARLRCTRLRNLRARLVRIGTSVPARTFASPRKLMTGLFSSSFAGRRRNALRLSSSRCQLFWCGIRVALLTASVRRVGRRVRSAR